MKYCVTLKVLGYMRHAVSYHINGGDWEIGFLLMFRSVQAENLIGQLVIHGKHQTALPKMIQDRLKQKMQSGRFHTVPFHHQQQQQQGSSRESLALAERYLKNNNFDLVDEKLKDCSGSDLWLLQDNISDEQCIF